VGRKISLYAHLYSPTAENTIQYSGIEKGCDKAKNTKKQIKIKRSH